MAHLLSKSGGGAAQQHRDLSLLLEAVKSCSASRDLERGKRIHASAIQSGHDSNIFVANSLVNMYARCGSLEDAKLVFDRISCRTIVSWNTLMLGYVESGQGERALELFSSMTVAPNARSFAAAVKACSVLAGRNEEKIERVLDLHSLAVKVNVDSDIFVATSLVDVYSKCGSLANARKAFERSSRQDVVLWTALILGFVENDENEVALEFFSRMVLEGGRPNARTYVAAAKACSDLAEKEDGKLLDGNLVKVESLERGISLHSQATKSGFQSDSFLASTMIDMFAKCGSLVDAQRVFDDSSSKDDVVLWNVLMSGYVDNGEEATALKIFERMRKFKVCAPSQRTFVASLKACSNLAAKASGEQVDGKLVKLEWLEKGMDVHSGAAKNGFETDLFVANSLVDLYAKCGSMTDARRVFDGMESYDFVSWNTLIVGYVENGEELLALELFTRMGCTKNSGVYVTVLKACICHAAKEQGQEIAGKVVKLKSLEIGMALHTEASKSGLASDVHVSSSLVELYAGCGSLVDARHVFDKMERHDVVSWTTLIDGFAERGQALKACVSAVDLKAGSSIHAQVCRNGLENDPVLATCLVDFLSKSGSMGKAQLDIAARETPQELSICFEPCKMKVYSQTR